ncbi:UDP-N-acetylmuramoyl-tripeptide--D-alanyl-D-alanine ligase [Nitratireductor soli]|uniref:UDP-N-acetylmuramoyl-tripeptide--D-alanyl-D- alanine ligase n=1 Tax=Nitratireductor soli TaxID=1670619 RepID=UPI000ABEFC87|nr:Mur ligase family protein [Nitratireductor soli]
MDAKLDTVDNLSSMRAFLRTRIVGLEPPFPQVVLFFSISDGDSRARVVNASGVSLESAWQKGLAALREIMKGEQLAGRWLRIDWVERAERTNWQRLRALLAKTKRNYFRYGLALDPDLQVAFTEMELNANAALYGGNTMAHAVFNQKNFFTYAHVKYPDLESTTFDDDAEVYLLSTRGVFCDEAGNLHELNGSGLDAGRRDVPELGAGDVTALVRDASAYLARQVDRDGAFVYGYHPCFDRRIATYNTLRHASTTYAMVEAWEVTRDARLKAAIDRSLKRLCDAHIQTCPLPDGTEAAFLVDVGNEVKLGGNAVAILALAKYAAATGTTAHHATMERLALGIRYMQDQETGAFRHVLNFPDLDVKQDFRTIYYEGEAAFGLMRLYGLTGDPRWLEMVEKAFEHFIRSDHWKHHDHWLSYCVNELTRHRPEERYFRFGISNVAGYLDFVSDRITTFPTLLELMMAARETLARIDERPELHRLFADIDLKRFESALEKRAHYLLNGHFWPEIAMFFRKPDRIVGSFFIRHHAFRVRIDDVEHYLSGFVAYRRYLEERNAFRRLVARHSAPQPGSSAPAGIWTAEQVEAATGGTWVRKPPAGWSACGLSTFAPAMQPGDMAVVRTGDEKVGMLQQVVRRMQPPPSALVARDAAAVDVPDVPLLSVPDCDEAVLSMGRYARARMTGKVLGVTGSSGKTTAVAMLAHALSAHGTVAKSAHNANLPHGVGWNLASIPWDTQHIVMELAVGRMAVSARMARPQVAIFTNIAPAHLSETSTVTDIARTKSAIFLGMSPGDVAVINRDMLEWETVRAAAERRNLRIVQYGSHADCDFRLVAHDAGERLVTASIGGRERSYRVGAAGRHMALNSLAVLAAVSALGYPLEAAIAKLGTFAPLPGRGQVCELSLDGRRLTVIDDAYNANPGSMEAAFDALGEYEGAGRRVAVLGQMAELGPQSRTYHTQLAKLIENSAIDRVYVTGQHYEEFWRVLPRSRKGLYLGSLDAMKEALEDQLADGDVVLVKGSNSTRMYDIVAWFKEMAQAGEEGQPAHG